MNRLLHIGGIVLLAAAILAAIVSFTSPGQVVLGVNLGLAAILLVGGFIVLGLAGVLSALEEVVESARRQTGQAGAAAPWLVPGAAQAGAVAAQPGDEGELDHDLAAEPRQPSVDMHETAAEDSPVDMEVAEEELQAEAEIGPVASASEGEDVEQLGEPRFAAEPSDAEEPLTALSAGEERARATGPDEAGEDWEREAIEPALERPEPERDELPELAEEFAEEPAQLYVVEERRFHGRPARLLSDGTVEAETDEGWLRFEDFDHLQEYLDAMAAVQRRRS
jgi:hypothetical protein